MRQSRYTSGNGGITALRICVFSSLLSKTFVFYTSASTSPGSVTTPYFLAEILCSTNTAAVRITAATGSVTNVSESIEGNNPVAAGYKIMHGTEDVTDNYTITTVAGKLTINPKDVTITAANTRAIAETIKAGIETVLGCFCTFGGSSETGG